MTLTQVDHDPASGRWFKREIKACKALGYRAPDMRTVTMDHYPTKYSKPLKAWLPDGTPLDPFYAAKASGQAARGDCLWITGCRPLELFDHRPPTPRKPAPPRARASKGFRFRAR